MEEIESYEEALRKIREATLSGAKTLTLNSITKIPSQLWELTNLESLTIRGGNHKYIVNGSTTIDRSELGLEFIPPEIGKLKKLKYLDLRGNNLSSLPPEIGSLTELEFLDLSNDYEEGESDDEGGDWNTNQHYSGLNHITQLPPSFVNLKKLSHLDLRGNVLTIPSEIGDRIDRPSEILNYYFSIQKSAIRSLPIHEMKLILVGEGSVGKTSLVMQIINGKFERIVGKTEGIAIARWHVRSNYGIHSNKQDIAINLWDFGGQEIMHAMHQFFLTKRSLYLLILDSRLTQGENRVEYWLKIIQSFGGESPVLIVGNKIDQHPLDIDRTGLQKKYPNIMGILETSAATGAGIEELKVAIAEQVNNLQHVRDLLPETWFTVKTKLEGLGRDSNFITYDKYLELCAENEVNEEASQRTLIGFLHDLGVILHFQDDSRLEALGILNPQWVTNGVYKILNSHTLFQNKGVLTLALLNSILNIDGYPRDKRLFIVDMMKKFELCYDIEPDKTFLVPDLLPKDEPAELKFKGIPAFEYAYPVLPSSIITRFIVRMNQKIENHFVWRTGVVLKIGENKALVKADLEDRKITIAIDGLEHTRRDALSAIRYQLNEIHGSIKGLNPEKYVPVPGAPDADPLEYETLLMMEREGIEITHVKSGRKLVGVNISQMLNGVESEYQRKQYGNVINIHGNINGSTIIAGDENDVN
jgi:internalin A